MSNIPPALEDGWHADEKAHKLEERRFWRFQRITGAITLLFSFIAAAGAVSAVGIAYNAFIASTAAVGEAKRQADVAKDTEIRQLRAYLSVAHGPIQATDSDVAVDILIFHAGGTPAYRIRLDAMIEVGSYLLNQTKLTNPDVPPGTRIGIPRYQYAALYSGSAPIKQAIKMAQPASEAIRLVKNSDYLRGQIYAYYMHGRVRYMDIFNAEHAYDFCFVFRGNLGFEGSEEGCEQYNKPG